MNSTVFLTLTGSETVSSVVRQTYFDKMIHEAYGIAYERN